MNNVPWLALGNPQQLFILKGIFILRGGVTTSIMIGENQQLVTYEPIEFEKWTAEDQGCRKITDHFEGIHKIDPNLVTENRRMSTCNWLDFQTLGISTGGYGPEISLAPSALGKPACN